MEKKILKRLHSDINRKFCPGKKAEWTDKDFGDLSDDIYKVSGVLISVTTLKRVWGKVKTYKEVYKPQLDTKNALAVYLGFPSWDEYENLIRTEKFVKNESESVKQSNEFITHENKELNPDSGKKRKGTMPILLLIALLVFVAIWFIISNNKLTEPSPEKVKQAISYQSELSRGEFPFTAKIHYDLSKLKPTSQISVHFADSFDNISRKAIILDRNKKLITHSYLIPDYYQAKIMLGQQVLDTLTFHATTKNWQAVVTYKNTENKYVFYPVVKAPFQQGMLFTDAQTIERMGINRKDVYWVEYRNVRDFSVKVDSLVLTTRVLNTNDEGGVYCNDIILFLRGDKSFLQFNLLKKGCTQWSNIIAADTRISGQTSDLSFMGVDVSTWGVIKLKTKQDSCSIWYDDKLLYSFQYSGVIGNLKNLQYVFKGNGKVDWVRVEDLSGKVVFSDDF